jgi:hypothetical protein
MTGDNWIFDVNGYEKKQLRAILDLAVMLTGYSIKAYRVNPTMGIILYWYTDESDKDPNIIKFPLENKGLILETLWAYLKETKWSVKPESWEEDCDHDGHNELGFRVKTGDWGKVSHSGTFLLIKPVYIWFGK